jgi:hypothetical protein
MNGYKYRCVVTNAIGGVNTDAVTLTVTALKFMSSVASGSISIGGLIILTPSIPGGTWNYDNSCVTLASDTSGAATIKGLKAGTTTVTYTAQGATISYAINIADASPSAGLKLTSSNATGKIFKGGRITLTPSVSGGTWSYDSSFVTLTQNSNGTVTFKALKAGTTTVTYTAQGASVSYTITIAGSSLPTTGQDYTWVWVLMVFALLAAAAGAAAVFRKHLVSKVK